jgi:hypothetical protein
MEMDVDQIDPSTPRNLVLSPDELSKLNKNMNLLSTCWTLPEAEDDVDGWNKLMVLVIVQLSVQLSLTSKRDLFSLCAIPLCAIQPAAERFVGNLKNGDLKGWKELVRIAMKEGDWQRLVMHRTSLLPERSNVIKRFHSKSL